MKDWVKGCDMGFYVGQKVVSERGEGTVISTNHVGTLPILVKIDECELSYMKDGCYATKDKLPSLYPIELTPKFYQPEWQPKEGEWCWFWNSEYKVGVIGKFITRRTNRYYVASGIPNDWQNCAPFDKDNMTPPWERGEEK